MSIEVFDNFLLKEHFDKIQNTMYSVQFPWFYIPGKSYGPLENDGNKEVFQFIHMFHIDHSFRSQFSHILDPIISLLNPAAIIRIKANLTTITPQRIQYEHHRDVGLSIPKSKTACYYVNTNNGSTVFMSGEEISSVANRLVIFDSDAYHCGTSCTDESTRIVINFNYFSKL